MPNNQPLEPLPDLALALCHGAKHIAGFGWWLILAQVLNWRIRPAFSGNSIRHYQDSPMRLHQLSVLLLLGLTACIDESSDDLPVDGEAGEPKADAVDVPFT